MAVLLPKARISSSLNVACMLRQWRRRPLEARPLVLARQPPLADQVLVPAPAQLHLQSLHHPDLAQAPKAVQMLQLVTDHPAQQQRQLATVEALAQHQPALQLLQPTAALQLLQWLLQLTLLQVSKAVTVAPADMVVAMVAWRRSSTCTLSPHGLQSLAQEKHLPATLHHLRTPVALVQAAVETPDLRLKQTPTRLLHLVVEAALASLAQTKAALSASAAISGASVIPDVL